MKSVLSFAAIAAFAGVTSASVILFDFEGLGDLETVEGFYNGGTGGDGSSGTNYGVDFALNAIAIIDEDAGGSGNFGNEPSPDTVLTFGLLDATAMNVAAGFDTGFGIDYSSRANFGTIEVWSGLNGTGTLLGSVDLHDLGAGLGDPHGALNVWDRATVSFSGTAKSVVFTLANAASFDNVSLGNTLYVVPLPSAALAGLGLLGGLGVVRRLRK